MLPIGLSEGPCRSSSRRSDARPLVMNCRATLQTLRPSGRGSALPRIRPTAASRRRSRGARWAPLRERKWRSNRRLEPTTGRKGSTKYPGTGSGNRASNTGVSHGSLWHRHFARLGLVEHAIKAPVVPEGRIAARARGKPPEWAPCLLSNAWHKKVCNGTLTLRAKKLELAPRARLSSGESTLAQGRQLSPSSQDARF